MNKKQAMGERILRHGLALRRLFCNDDWPKGSGLGPVAPCKALRRIETKADRISTDYCNGVVEIEVVDAFEERAYKRIAKLLPKLPAEAFHYNRDPRGYALKIDDKYMREHKIDLHRDFGGYGILAPDLREQV